MSTRSNEIKYITVIDIASQELYIVEAYLETIEEYNSIEDYLYDVWKIQGSELSYMVTDELKQPKLRIELLSDESCRH